MRPFFLRSRFAAGFQNAVYVWPASKGYYAEKAVPRRIDVRARPADTAEEIVSRLPATVRAFLFHIDLTETGNYPLDRRGLIEKLKARSIRVLNAGVTSIAKRTLYDLARQIGAPCLQATPDGDAQELLIAKTNRNYGGRNERLLPRRDRRLLGMSEGSSHIRGAFDYKVLPRAHVPRSWWEDPDLVLERYISNREHRFHRVHIVLDHFAFFSGVSSLQIIKIRDCTDTREYFLRRGEMSDMLPRTLLKAAYDFAEAFSLDFGALDFVADDTGGYYAIDVNATPWRATESNERFSFLQAAWNKIA